MTLDQHHPRTPFDRWDADDALDALYRAGLDLDHVEQARWPPHAPQPRTHRQAFTFRSPGSADPHLLLTFDEEDGLEAWRLWLQRYWKARPYLSIHDNVLLLVSRDLSVEQAAVFHAALATMRHIAEVTPSRTAAARAAPEPSLETRNG